jgi:antitoxin (DNA-binding transcriptional repressor) of toxin-antitoxin stability system
VVERHGRPVAAIVGIQRFASLAELEADLRSAVLVLAREATTNADDAVAHHARRSAEGDRAWRIVWRVTTDGTGTVTITIGEAWVIGARSDADVLQGWVGRRSDLGASVAATR